VPSCQRLRTPLGQHNAPNANLDGALHRSGTAGSVAAAPHRAVSVGSRDGGHASGRVDLPCRGECCVPAPCCVVYATCHARSVQVSAEGEPFESVFVAVLDSAHGWHATCHERRPQPTRPPPAPAGAMLLKSFGALHKQCANPPPPVRPDLRAVCLFALRRRGRRDGWSTVAECAQVPSVTGRVVAHPSLCVSCRRYCDKVAPALPLPSWHVTGNGLPWTVPPTKGLPWRQSPTKV
jgi:hypothetical protein